MMLVKEGYAHISFCFAEDMRGADFLSPHVLCNLSLCKHIRKTANLLASHYPSTEIGMYNVWSHTITGN